MERLIYLFKTFIMIGSTSFGGYMALISIMRNRMVVRDKSIDDNLITEGISLASMLPGPVAVNVVAYAGFHIAGIAGALISVISVLIPAFLMVLLLTLVYIQAGSKIEINSILQGIFPVVAGVIFSTGISMGKKACSRFPHYVIAVLCFALQFILKGYSAILISISISAIAGVVLFRNNIYSNSTSLSISWKSILFSLIVYCVIFIAIILFGSESVLTKLFEQFSYVSLTLFGGGYVMIPVMKSILVDQLNWFSNHEFIYGISIGQVTPGPILISSVFFGYMMAGVMGSLIATFAIFFPSAMLMIITSSIFTSLKYNKFVQSGLMGIKPAITGMILSAGVSIFTEQMKGGNLLISVTLSAITFWLVFRFNVATAVIILCGGILGFLIY